LLQRTKARVAAPAVQQQAGSSQGAAWPNSGSPQDRRKTLLQTFVVVVVVVVAEQVERGLSFEAHICVHMQ
jgi:hypothetical protein